MGSPNFKHPLMGLMNGPSCKMTVFMPKRERLEADRRPSASENWDKYHSPNGIFVDWSKCLLKLQKDELVGATAQLEWKDVRQNGSKDDQNLFWSLFNDMYKIFRKFRKELDEMAEPGPAVHPEPEEVMRQKEDREQDEKAEQRPGCGQDNAEL